MNRFLFAVESVTYARKGRDLLRKKGIPADIERIPRLRKGQGCGFGIAAEGDPNKAADLLKANGIRVFYGESGGVFLDLP